MNKILATIGVVLVITLLITAAITQTQTTQAKKHNPLNKVKKALRNLENQGNVTPNIPIITTNPMAKVGDALAAMKANLSNMTTQPINITTATKK